MMLILLPCVSEMIAMSCAWREYRFLHLHISTVSHLTAHHDDEHLRYLSYKLQPKATPTTAESHPPEHDSGGFERDYTSRVSGAVSGAIFSIGDLFRDYREGTKAVRFPKDLLKVLEQKLQDIAMGKDPA